jgi:hypothetical protein
MKLPRFASLTQLISEMKAQEKHEFDKVHDQMRSLYHELSVLSKKSTNTAINKFKLKFVNSILGQSNQFLKEKYKPFKDFSLFDADEMPSNSDVALILGQYLKCMEKFRIDNTKSDSLDWR